MGLDAIKISGIEFNIDLAVKRLKQDLRDDWFPDLLEFKDVLDSKEFLIEIFKEYDESKKKYQPNPALHFDIPKPGFTIRYSTETNLIDRIVYQGCIDIIAPHLDKIHSPSVYSHRVNTDRSSKHLFKYAVEEWNKFLTDASLELEDQENEVLLVTDLSNYYESISTVDLYNTLKFQINNLEIKDELKPNLLKVAELLKKLLQSWCEPHTKRGIPQNRDASSFLSNIFLNSVDDSMLNNGFKYFRYMDDIRIVCRNQYEARKALKILVNELRKKGLNVNSKKTEILNLNNPKDRDAAKASLQRNDIKIDQIENLLKSRTARGVQIAVPMLRDKTIALIEGNGTLQRHFRFCINRLERLLRIPELRGQLKLSEITNKVLDELLNQPWSTDTFARYLISENLSASQLSRIKDILLDGHKNIYEWQEYHLWRILISHKYKNKNLLELARNYISQNNPIIPIYSIAATYLCALGKGNDRRFVSDNFKQKSDFFSQRALLIGIKKLDYSSIIKPLVQPHILECHKGSYTQLKKQFKNEFILHPERLNFKDFYDELPEFIS